MRIRGMGTLRRTARRAANLFVRRAVILLYHRVADLASDPQLLSVTPQHFAEHLAILQKYYRPLPLRQIEHPAKRSVVVTFDDGYADNLWNAKPLLERYNVPATVFVTTGYIGRNREFWWDELERMLLGGGRLPQVLCLKINGESRKWELEPNDTYQPSHSWNVSEKNDPSPRYSVYRSLHQLLRYIPETEQQMVFEQLRHEIRPIPAERPMYRALSPDEIIRLGEGSLVEVGGHTVTHPVLSALPEAGQLAEIKKSKEHLEELLGHPVTSFAYPYGSLNDYNGATVAAVRKSGYVRSCSNFCGMIGPSSDRFQLPRFLVRDWDGEEFNRRLDEWLSA